jgi:hypothetical protein
MDMMAPMGDEKAPTLRVSTQPADAQVLLDDRVLGSTPLVSWELPPGLHQLTLKKEGFAPRTLRVCLMQNLTVNLAMIPLARQDTLITIWRVGCPHDGGTPPARIPDELEALITATGFRVRILSLAATAFPREFARVLQEGDRRDIPDIVTGNNWLPFESTGEPLEVCEGGALTMIDRLVFLVPRSLGHVAARQVASANRGMAAAEGWSLDELRWQDLPGQMRSPDRAILEHLNYQAVSTARGNLGVLGTLLRKDMLFSAWDNEKDDWSLVESKAGMIRADASPRQSWFQGNIRTLYILGNSRLAFVLAAVSGWDGVACREVLSVWVKEEERWSLLTITGSIDLQATREDIPRLAGALVESTVERIRPATSLALITPKIPHWDDVFRWTPSSSKDVIAEIAEFHSDGSTRLCINYGGLVSTEGFPHYAPMTWRVWSVGKDGQVVISASGPTEPAEGTRMTETDWLEANSPAQMLAYLGSGGSERKVRLLACGGCRHIWHLLPDARCRAAVVVAESYADRRADRAALEAARDDLASIAIQDFGTFGALARENFDGVPDAEGVGTVLYQELDDDDWAATTVLATYCALVCPALALGVVLRASIRSRPWQQRQGAFAVGGMALCNLIRDICGNPFHPAQLCPSWLTSTTLTLARGIYEECAFDRMPMLADALEAAGCTNRAVLDHCRQPSVHVRGCWVLDLVLAKH